LIILGMHQIKATRGSSDAIMHALSSPSAQVALITKAPTAATRRKNGSLKCPLGAGFIHILVCANPGATRSLRRKVSRLCRLLDALFQLLAPSCRTRDEAPIACLYDENVEENPNEILLFPIYDDAQNSADSRAPPSARAPTDNHSNAIYTSTIARCSNEATIHLKEYTPSRRNYAYNVTSSPSSDGRFPLQVLTVRVSGDSSPEKRIFDTLAYDEDHPWNCALPENRPALVPPSSIWNLPLEVSIKDSDVKHDPHSTALGQDQIDQGNAQIAGITSRDARPSDPLASVYQEEVSREDNFHNSNGAVQKQSSIPFYNLDMSASKMNAKDISPRISSSFHSYSEDFIPVKRDDVGLSNHVLEKSTSINNDYVEMTSSAESNSSSLSSKRKEISQEEDPWKHAFERAEIYDKKYSNDWHDSGRPQEEDKKTLSRPSGRKNKTLSLSTINEK